MPRVTPLTPGAARAVIRYGNHADNETGKWTNRLDFRWNAGAGVPIPDADLTQLATDVYAAADGHLRARMSASVDIVRVDAYDLGDPSRAPLTHGSPIQGQGTVKMAPLDSALVGTLETARIGRSFHGRFYHSGLETAQLQDGADMWTEDACDSVIDFLTAADVMTPDSGAFHLAVISLRTGGVYRANGLITNVTGVHVTRVPGTVFAPVVSMRLRLPSQRKRRKRVTP